MFLARDEDKGSDGKEKCAPELRVLAFDKSGNFFASYMYTKKRKVVII